MAQQTVDNPGVAAIPLTALVPEEVSGTITVLAKQTALRMAVIEPVQGQSLKDEWSKPGVYVLLSRHEPDRTWKAYVGKAASTDGLAGRIKKHDRDWYRAVLVTRDTPEGFNSAEAGWLEGHLYDLLDAAEYANLVNKNRPSDETLPLYDRQMLETLIPPIEYLLRLIGHDTATAGDEITNDESPPQSDQRQSRFYGIKIKDLLNAGFLKAEDQIVSTNGRWPATARITPQGKIEHDGNEYDTPSPAASAASHGGAAPGWDFWAIQSNTGLVPLKTLRARYLREQQEPKVST